MAKSKLEQAAKRAMRRIGREADYFECRDSYIKCGKDMLKAAEGMAMTLEQWNLCNDGTSESQNHKLVSVDLLRKWVEGE